LLEKREEGEESSHQPGNGPDSNEAGVLLRMEFSRLQAPGARNI
jgi:hypothetical protein